jgi:hypothetical protein
MALSLIGVYEQIISWNHRYRAKNTLNDYGGCGFIVSRVEIIYNGTEDCFGNNLSQI